MKLAKWQLQEAKSRLSEVVNSAVRDGPQVITRRGTDVVVVVGVETWRSLLYRRQPLSTFLRESPFGEDYLDVTRDASAPRPPLEL